MCVGGGVMCSLLDVSVCVCVGVMCSLEVSVCVWGGDVLPRSECVSQPFGKRSGD